MWHLIETHDDKQVIKDWDHYPTGQELYELNYFSCSHGYPTKEDLFKGEQILDQPCVVCGISVNKSMDIFTLSMVLKIKI